MKTILIIFILLFCSLASIEKTAVKHVKMFYNSGIITDIAKNYIYIFIGSKSNEYKIRTMMQVHDSLKFKKVEFIILEDDEREYNGIITDLYLYEKQTNN